MSAFINTIETADEQRDALVAQFINAIDAQGTPAKRKAYLVRDVAASITERAKLIGELDAASMMRVLPSESTNGIFTVEIAEVAGAGVAHDLAACQSLEKWARNRLNRYALVHCKAYDIEVEGMRAARESAPKAPNAAKMKAQIVAKYGQKFWKALISA